MAAINQKHLRIIRKLLGAGVDPNNYDPESEHAPMVQVGYVGSTDIARELVNRGAKFDALDSREETALVLASFWGHFDLVSYLLSGKIDLSFNSQGKISLLKAIDQDHHRIVRSLLEYGQNPNCEDPEIDKVPIIQASYKDNEKTISLLIKHGADVNASGHDSSTPIITAAFWGHEKSLALLLENGVILSKENQGFRALITSIERGHFRITRKLLQAGVDPENYDPEVGPVPMVSAAGNGTVKTLEILLEYKHNINSIRHDNHTALTIATFWDHREIVAAAIEANVAMEEHRQGWRALRIAIERGHHRIMKLLLTAGVDPNPTYEDEDQNPILSALRQGNIETLKILLEGGADPSKYWGTVSCPLLMSVHLDHYDAGKYFIENTSAGEDTELITRALECAEKQGRSRLQQLFEESLRNTEDSVSRDIFTCIRLGELSTVRSHLAENPLTIFSRLSPTDQTPLMRACVENRPDIVEYLLGLGAHVDASDNERQTPLTLATRLGLHKIVHILLQHGANPNLSTGPQNKTPLMIAIENEHKEIFDLLLQHNASVGYPDLQLKTPLMYAAEEGQDYLLLQLIERGARIQERDSEDSTAIMLASYKQHQKTAQILLENGATIETKDLRKLSGIEWLMTLIKQFARKSLSNFF